MSQGNPVEIMEYDPRWARVFADLHGVIGAALGDLALAIEHVGSTAVVGLAAKPIVDVDVVIARGSLAGAVKALAGLGYVHQGDLGIAGREAFKRLGEDVPREGTGRTWMEHHLYVCEPDSLELRRHLAFRNYLRGNPEQARAYGQLKRKLAGRFRFDRNAYVEGKSEFIGAVLREILA